MTRCTLSKWKWQLFPILDNLACMRQSPNYGISFSFQVPMCATVQTILLPHNINVSPREESKIQSVHLLPAHCRSEFPTGWAERTRGWGPKHSNRHSGDSSLLHFLLHIQSQNWLKCFTFMFPQKIFIYPVTTSKLLFISVAPTPVGLWFWWHSRVR